MSFDVAIADQQGHILSQALRSEGCRAETGGHREENRGPPFSQAEQRSRFRVGNRRAIDRQVAERPTGQIGNAAEHFHRSARIQRHHPIADPDLFEGGKRFCRNIQPNQLSLACQASAGLRQAEGAALPGADHQHFHAGPDVPRHQGGRATDIESRQGHGPGQILRKSCIEAAREEDGVAANIDPIRIRVNGDDLLDFQRSQRQADQAGDRIANLQFSIVGVAPANRLNPPHQHSPRSGDRIVHFAALPDDALDCRGDLFYVSCGLVLHLPERGSIDVQVGDCDQQPAVANRQRRIEALGPLRQGFLLSDHPVHPILLGIHRGEPSRSGALLL